jgi:hypothetical protein
MNRIRRLFVAVVAASAVFSANAAEDTLLIQMEQNGSFKVWHGRGETQLSDAELQALDASAAPEGGPPIATAAGLARAYETPDGIRIDIPEAPRDKTLLYGRDNCGGVSIWHSTGSIVLTDEQLTELVVNALPLGGKGIPVGTRVAKPYTTRIGVIVVIWQPHIRRP